MSSKNPNNDNSTGNQPYHPAGGCNYNRAKRQFLEWVKDEAEDRGFNPTIDFSANVLFENDDIIIRTRATHYQYPPYKFKVNDEVRAEIPEFDQSYSVLLVLQSRREFDPSVDDFYPLSLNYYQKVANRDRNSDYPISIDPHDAAVSGHKNSFDRMFPPSGEFEPDMETQRAQQTDQKPSDRVQHLMQVYENVCDTDDEM